MARVNKFTTGFFVIQNEKNKIGEFEKFARKNLDLNDNASLKHLNTYCELIEKTKSTHDKLALLEVIIMQEAARNSLKEMKFSTVREYIYARSPFYRRDKTSKDIRVIVGMTEFHGTDVAQLYFDESFVKKAKLKIQKAMEKEIAENIKELESL
jgi:hypothetical protein